MTRDEVERWERTRQRGLLRFVVVSGVGKVGLGFFALFAGLDYLTRYGFEFTPVFFTHLLRWLPGAVVVGAVFGFFFFRSMEKRYRESVPDH